VKILKCEMLKCVLNFRKRGVWFCLCGRDYLTKLLPGYLHVFLYASEEEYGGLMVTGEICIAISVSCDFSVD